MLVSCGSNLQIWKKVDLQPRTRAGDSDSLWAMGIEAGMATRGWFALLMTFGRPLRVKLSTYMTLVSVR